MKRKGKWEVIPVDGKYPGMTKYTAPDGRTFACVGVGEEVERALKEKAGE